MQVNYLIIQTRTHTLSELNFVSLRDLLRFWSTKSSYPVLGCVFYESTCESNAVTTILNIKISRTA